jgi:hypothetical protein
VPAVEFEVHVEHGALAHRSDAGLGVEGAETEQWYPLHVEVQLDDKAIAGDVHQLEDAGPLLRWEPDPASAPPMTSGEHELVVRVHLEALSEPDEWSVPFTVPPFPIRVAVLEAASPLAPPPLEMVLDDGPWTLETRRRPMRVRLQGPQGAVWAIEPEGDQTEHLRPACDEDHRCVWHWSKDADVPPGEYHVAFLARRDDVVEPVGEVDVILDPLLVVEPLFAEEGRRSYLPPLRLMPHLEGWALGISAEGTPQITSSEEETRAIEILIDGVPRSGVARVVGEEATGLTWSPGVSFDVAPLTPGPHRIEVRVEGEGAVVATGNLEIEEPLVVQYRHGNLRQYPQPTCPDTICLEDPPSGTELNVFARFEEGGYTYLLLRRMDTEALAWGVLNTSEFSRGDQALTADSPEILALPNFEGFQIQRLLVWRP